MSNQSIFFDVIARDKASSTFSKIGRASGQTHSRLGMLSRSALGAAAGLTSITLAAGAFLKTGASYVDSLNKIQALTGANDQRMQSAAKTLESNTSTYARMGQTVSDAADGVVELTKAGMGLGQSMKAVSATMILAKAGSLEVADAAALVSNSLNVWREDNLKAGEAANVLANAANISSADVSDLAQSLQMASNVAASAGASFQETNAMLAMLANAGMKGSDAGTSLKTMLLSLQAPSSTASKGLKAVGVNAFDAAGKARPLREVLADLDGKFKDLSDQERAKRLKQIFGTDAYRAAKVVFGQHIGQFDEYVRKVNKAGAAQKLAESSSKGLAGTMKRLKAEVTSTGQAAYRDLSPKLDEAAKKLAKFVEQMRSGEGAGGDFVDLLKDLVTVGKGAVKILDAIPGPVIKFGIQALVASVALRKLTAVTSSFGSSLASPIAKAKQFRAELTYTETRMQRVSVASRALSGALKQVGGAAGMLAVVHGAQQSNKALGALEMTAGAAAAGFAVGGPLGAALGGTVGYLGALIKATKGSGTAVKDTLSTWKTYVGTLNEVSAATTRATRAMVLERMEKTGLLTKTRELNISDRDAIQAALGNEAARKRVVVAMRAATEAGKGYQALEIGRRLGVETVAINSSRIAQLRKNLALAATKEEAQRIQNKLDRLANTNANPSITISGAGRAIRELTAISVLLHDITRSKPKGSIGTPNTTLGGMLGAERRAAGGPVTAGMPYVVNDRGPRSSWELFVPNESGRILPHVPSGSSGGGEQVIEVHLHLDGETIVKQVKARNRRKGVAAAGI